MTDAGGRGGLRCRRCFRPATVVDRVEQVQRIDGRGREERLTGVLELSHELGPASARSSNTLMKASAAAAAD
jgi:hypothetical protein